MGMISYIKEELNVIKERDPAIKTGMEVLLYSSFKAILSYRVAHKLFLNKHYFLARWVSQRAARKTGIEIHPGATIGKGLFIDHGSGVIIGETTVIGDNVTLYQGVTLGGKGETASDVGRQCYGERRSEDSWLFHDRGELKDRCRLSCSGRSPAKLYGGRCTGKNCENG